MEEGFVGKVDEGGSETVGFDLLWKQVATGDVLLLGVLKTSRGISGLERGRRSEEMLTTYPESSMGSIRS